jgi:queuine tRNA-ribosyltransferase
MSNFFKVSHTSSKSKARLGEIKTSHGVINTPSFVAVGTKGTVKALTPSILKDIGTQVAFVNTYHLVTHPGPEIIEKAGGIHNYSKLNIPLMSDSGGFQVFSLGREQRKANVRGEEEPLVVKISEDGVKFRSSFDGALIEFTPEKSMEFQRKIGADINMAFDECTYYPATHEYAARAMERTHKWLKRCIKYKDNGLKNKQYLYGVIQGGTFEDLRKKSAEFVVAQNTPGVAIGGVSVGESKTEMRKQVGWVSGYLPKDRPVHLLGVGQIDDIVDLVKYGIDTFDCVEPTRLARMGSIYQMSTIKSQISGSIIENKEIDITKTVFKDNLEKVDKDCSCYVCQNFTKSYLHHLFKQREILGYTLATFHNLWVMEKLFEKIRELIAGDMI